MENVSLYLAAAVLNPMITVMLCCNMIPQDNEKHLLISIKSVLCESLNGG